MVSCNTLRVLDEVQRADDWRKARARAEELLASKADRLSAMEFGLKVHDVQTTHILRSSYIETEKEEGWAGLEIGEVFWFTLENGRRLLLGKLEKYFKNQGLIRVQIQKDSRRIWDGQSHLIRHDVLDSQTPCMVFGPLNNLMRYSDKPKPQVRRSLRIPSVAPWFLRVLGRIVGLFRRPAKEPLYSTERRDLLLRAISAEEAGDVETADKLYAELSASHKLQDHVT